MCTADVHNTQNNTSQRKRTDLSGVKGRSHRRTVLNFHTRYSFRAFFLLFFLIQIFQKKNPKKYWNANKTGANGNGLLKVCFCGAIIISTWNLTGLVSEVFTMEQLFTKVLKDTPQYALKFQSSPGMGRIF